MRQVSGFYYVYFQKMMDFCLSLLQNPSASTVDTLYEKSRLHRQWEKQVFDELDRVFLPPLDREDLWLLCANTALLTERLIHLSAEMHRQHTTTFPNDCQAVVSALLRTVSALQAVMADLPSFRHSRRLEPSLEKAETSCREAHRLCFSDINHLRLRDRLEAVCEQSGRLCQALRYVLLRNR